MTKLNSPKSCDKNQAADDDSFTAAARTDSDIVSLVLYRSISVTRFGEFLSLWQDVKTLVILKQFIWYLANFLTYFGKFYMPTGKILMLETAKYFTNNRAIWSHWSLCIFVGREAVTHLSLWTLLRVGKMTTLTSVTKLVYIQQTLAKNVLTKVAQIFDDILGYFENGTF